MKFGEKSIVEVITTGSDMLGFVKEKFHPERAKSLKKVTLDSLINFVKNNNLTTVKVKGYGNCLADAVGKPLYYISTDIEKGGVGKAELIDQLIPYQVGEKTAKQAVKSDFLAAKIALSFYLGQPYRKASTRLFYSGQIGGVVVQASQKSIKKYLPSGSQLSEFLDINGKAVKNTKIPALEKFMHKKATPESVLAAVWPKLTK